MGAQNNIDEIILKNLGKNKFFVEAGGSDPRDQNNTELLEKNGWNGIIIEPKKEFNDLYRNLRPKSIIENYVLVSNGHKEETIYGDFSHYMMGGVINIHNFDSWNPSEYPCATLDKILKKNHIKEVDFFSLDVEGYENQVLKGINFNEVFFHVIVLEKHIVNGILDNFDYLINFGFDKKLEIKQHEFYINKNSDYKKTFNF